MAYHPITKRMAQDRARGQKPVYGEVDGQRYRIISVGRLKCRSICGRTLDAARMQFDAGISVRDKK